MNLRLPFAAIALALLAACGGDAPAGAAPVPVADAPAAPAATPAASAASAEPQGDCDLLSASDVSAAFGGKLTVRRTHGRGARGGSCSYSLAEVADSQIILQAGDEAGYRALKANYASYRGVSMAPLAIGQEAFLVNGSQVIALADDGQSLSLGLTLIVFDTPMPLADDEVRTGVEALARQAFGRL